MTTFAKCKQTLADDPIAFDLSANSSNIPAQDSAVSARYFFNLTNGDTMIRDSEGIEACSIQAAVVSAMEAVEELRAQDSSHSDEWQGWRLEIVDASDRAIQIILLDALSAH